MGCSGRCSRSPDWGSFSFAWAASSSELPFSPDRRLEEGLLAILNGKTDLRFEIEHAELGGLVFRLNSLLNQLMGVQEDDTDDEVALRALRQRAISRMRSR